MDPNANLAEQLRLALYLLENFSDEGGVMGGEVQRLAELVIALNTWLSGGGFPPKAWNNREQWDRGAR